jgi:hypothetical protein
MFLTKKIPRWRWQLLRSRVLKTQYSYCIANFCTFYPALKARQKEGLTDYSCCIYLFHARARKYSEWLLYSHLKEQGKTPMRVYWKITEVLLSSNSGSNSFSYPHAFLFFETKSWPILLELNSYTNLHQKLTINFLSRCCLPHLWFGCTHEVIPWGQSLPQRCCDFLLFQGMSKWLWWVVLSNYSVQLRLFQAEVNCSNILLEGERLQMFCGTYSYLKLKRMPKISLYEYIP